MIAPSQSSSLNNSGWSMARKTFEGKVKYFNKERGYGFVVINEKGKKAKNFFFLRQDVREPLFANGKLINYRSFKQNKPEPEVGLEIVFQISTSPRKPGQLQKVKWWTTKTLWLKSQKEE